MNRIASTVGLVFGAAVASQAAYGTVVYQVNDATAIPANSRFRQAAGNNFYTQGDDANIGANAGMGLDTVKLKFAVFTYDTGFGTGTYAPSLKLEIYAIDSGTKLPIGAAPLATALQNNYGTQVLTGSNSPAGDFSEIFSDGSFQEFTFDFTSQNFVLPTEFALVPHDDTGGPGISAGLAVLASTVGPVIGTTNGDLFYSTPNDPNTDVFTAEGSLALGRYLVATIDASPIPEPASMALLGAGSLLMLRRRSARN